MIRQPAVLRRALRRMLQTRRCCTLAVGLGIAALMMTTAALAVQNWIDRQRPSSQRGPMPIAHKIAAAQQHMMALRLHESTLLRGAGSATARHEWELALASTERALRSLLTPDQPSTSSLAGVVQQSLTDLGEYARLIDAAHAQRIQQNLPLAAQAPEAASQRFVAVVRSSMTLAGMARMNADVTSERTTDASLASFAAKLLAWTAVALLVGVISVLAVAVGNVFASLVVRRRPVGTSGGGLGGQVA